MPNRKYIGTSEEIIRVAREHGWTIVDTFYNIITLSKWRGDFKHEITCTIDSKGRVVKWIHIVHMVVTRDRARGRTNRLFRELER